MKQLIGKKRPDILGSAVIDGVLVNEISLDKFDGKYIVLFFYPLDFTFVCPTELHAFQNQLADFETRGAQVIGCSVDSGFSHLAWLNIPKKEGGIQGVSYPLLSDLNKKIASDYGVLDEEAGVAFRGVFIIDRDGIIRHQLINDLPIGRNVNEILRTLDALLAYEEYGQVCPANWEKGSATMAPTSEGVVSYFR